MGVHNIGEGVVTLVDRGEEYIVTFPNGYGRLVSSFGNTMLQKKLYFISILHFSSILTVPWIELGGSVEIKCPQTGYHAHVEFLTKPFYGGKRNKVTCDVSKVNYEQFKLDFCFFLVFYFYFSICFAFYSFVFYLKFCYYFCDFRFIPPMKRNHLFRLPANGVA